MGLIYTLIDAADSAASEHRYERAQALASIAQARAMADIANARDGNLDSLAQRIRQLEVTVNALHRKVWPGDWEAES